MLLIGERAPGEEIVGEALRLRGDRLEQHYELVEVVEIVAGQQGRFVDVRARNM